MHPLTFINLSSLKNFLQDQDLMGQKCHPFQLKMKFQLRDLFSKEKVKNDIWQFGLNKTLSHDGFTMVVFQKYMG